MTTSGVTQEETLPMKHEPRCNERCQGDYHYMDNTVEGLMTDAVKKLWPDWREPYAAKVAGRMLAAIEGAGLVVQPRANRVKPFRSMRAAVYDPETGIETEVEPGV